MKIQQYVMTYLLGIFGSAFLLLLFAIPASAQLPGQRINPNVVLLLDSGSGMNWIKVVDIADNPEADTRMDDAVKACAKMNDVSPTFQSTAWQTFMEATLGSMPPEYKHCFYEAPQMRPYLHHDTISGLTETDEALVERMRELTIEYWEYSKTPHLRLINCYDPRESGNRGDWNDEYHQCIGPTADLDASLGEWIEYRGGIRYWCQKEIDGIKNYYPNINGDDVCFNMHPKALDRNTDGILERYRSLARFSLMTFDNLPSPTDEEALAFPDVSNSVDALHRSGWDFLDDREWYITKYEQPASGSLAARQWNAGIKGPYPQAVGRMVPLSSDFENSNQDIRHVLDTVEPVHCSFDAAMFDDAGEYLFNSPESRPAYNNGSDLFFNCRPKLAIFVTDGIQTDALEFPQSYCDQNSNAPKPPWDSTAPLTPYDCPFNSTSKEVDEMFRVVENMSALPWADVHPMYLVVIGLNMKDKEDAEPNRCDGIPTWVTSTLGKTPYCAPPGDDCIMLEEVDMADCTEGNATYIDAFVTPRQYLNILALKGWPDGTGDFPYTSYLDLNSGGKFRQPPWRTDSTLGLENPWCSGTGNESRCGGELNDGLGNGALFVDSYEDLAEVLDMVMQSISFNDVATRTELTSTNNVGAKTAGDEKKAQQYVFNTGYQATSGEPWGGFLFRQGYKCAQTDADASGGAVGTPYPLHEKIEPSTRKIWVVDPTKDVTYSGDDFINGKQDVLVEFSDSVVTDCVLGVPSCTPASTLYAAEVAKHLYGTIEPRKSKPLGDIYNSTPAILSPPTERIPYPSYHEFRSLKHKAEDEATDGTANSVRQPYLYVGTNDGILHSFNTWKDDASYSTLRAEGWGFVPSPLLSNTGLQFPVRAIPTYDVNGVPDGYTVETMDVESGFQHTFGVDAPPVAADVLVYKSGGTNEKKYWRSLVVGGLGKGGYGYYALDVTKKPEDQPSLRWELSPTLFGVNTGDAASETALAEMGMGLTRPELAYVYIDYATPEATSVEKEHQAAIAILPGGYKNTESGGLEVSTGVYIVRLSDGLLLRYLRTDIDADLKYPNSPMFDSQLFESADVAVQARAKTAQLIGQPIVPNGIKTGKVADEAYIGDDRGRIWRIDMSSKNPDDWSLEVFFDTLLAEHFPYRDCLNATADSPGANPACCDPKSVNVSAPCAQGDISGFAVDGLWGIDSCSGGTCRNPAYPFPRIPMLAPPTIVQDKERNNVLLFGTGQIDGLETLDHHRIFSVTVEPTISVTADNEGTASDNEAASALTRSDPEINWWLGEKYSSFPLGKHSGASGLAQIESSMFPVTASDKTHIYPDTAPGVFDYFGLGEKLLGRVHVFNEVAYFTSFTPLQTDSLDACSTGGSKIWGVSFNDGSDAIFPTLPDPTGVSTNKFPYYERQGQVLTGLRIVRRPACQGVEGFTLMVQKAQPSAATASPPGSVDNAAPITSESIAIDLPPKGVTRVGIDSWSIVMGGR